MTSEPVDPGNSLKRERDRLDSLLEANEAWRALRRLDDCASEGGAPAGEGASTLRKQLESSLAGDRIYQARCKISEAITLLEAPSDLAVAAVPVVAAPSLLPTDDLTLVRGIDSGLALRLGALGITSFADIATWSADDVRRISEALELDRRIQRQNWIEQAAMLAARLRPRPGGFSDPPPVDEFPRPASPSTAEVARLVSAAVRDILGRVAQNAQPQREPESAAAPATAVPLPLAADDLTLIHGLDTRAASGLLDSGIATYAAIAQLSAADIARLCDRLGPGVRRVAGRWIEQAAILAAGQSTHHARTSAIRAAIQLKSRPAATAVARDEGFACELSRTQAAIPSDRGSGPTDVLDSPLPAPYGAADSTWTDETALTSLIDLPAAGDAVSGDAGSASTIVVHAATSHAVSGVAPDGPANLEGAAAVQRPQLDEASQPRIVVALPPLSLRSTSEAVQPATPPTAEATADDVEGAEYGPVIDYNSDSLLDIAASNFSEAEVQIVSAARSGIDDAASTDHPLPLVYGGGAGSLQSRLQKAGESDEPFDSHGYAAYRTSVEEASVEIVHRGSDPRSQSAADDSQHSGPEDVGPKAVRRFLKVLTGQDR